MALIEAQRFTDLKARVKAECQRRSYTGSVASYGGTDYDYASAPASGVKIAQEHYEKLVIPLNAINSETFPDTSGERIITDADLTAMETFLTSAEGRGKTATTTDCSASCTGLCKGCTGTCTGSCSGGCSGTCKGTCEGCTGGCWGTCTGCTGSCTGSCTGGCKGTCTIAGAGTQ